MTYTLAVVDEVCWILPGSKLLIHGTISMPRASEFRLGSLQLCPRDIRRNSWKDFYHWRRWSRYRQSANKAQRFIPVVKFLGPFNLGPGKTNTHKLMLPQYTDRKDNGYCRKQQGIWCCRKSCLCQGSVDGSGDSAKGYQPGWESGTSNNSVYSERRY